MSMPMSMPPQARSGAVTALAVVNFIFGALRLLDGGLCVCGGALAALWAGTAEPETGRLTLEYIFAPVAGILAPFAVVIGVISMILGVPSIIAGFGVLKRRQWGRILTLILGGLSGAMAVFNLLNAVFNLGVTPNIVGLLIQGGYCAFVFIVLLNKQYAAEFQ